MKKNLLLIVLLLSLIFEGYLTCMAFIDPPGTLKLFKIDYNTNTAMLAYFIGWFLLLVSVICIYLMWLVKTNCPGTFGMINLLSIWWIGIGISIYISFGRPDNIFTDSIKGALLLAANFWYAKSGKDSTQRPAVN